MFKEEGRYTPDEFDRFVEQRQKGLLYTVMLGEHGHRQWLEMHSWCKEHTYDGTYHINYSWNGSYFHFRDEDIALQFRLIWG